MIARLAGDMGADVWLGVQGTRCANGDTTDYSNFASDKGSGDVLVLSATSGEWSTGYSASRSFGVCEVECRMGQEPSCVADDISSIAKSMA